LKSIFNLCRQGYLLCEANDLYLVTVYRTNPKHTIIRLISINTFCRTIFSSGTHRQGIAIEVNATEDTQIYTPLSSRIAHLVMIDVLAIGVAQKKGPKLEEHLQLMQAGLSSLRSS
jgi:hypothetical protein